MRVRTVAPWVLGLILVLALTAAAAEPGASDERSTKLCASNLQTVFRHIKLLEHRSGAAFPQDLRALYLMVEKPYYLTCPNDKGSKHPTGDGKEDARTSYAIVDNIEDLMAQKVDPALMAIVFEKKAFHNGRRHVLFYDGTIEVMNERQFKELKKNGFIRIPGQVEPTKSDGKPTELPHRG